MVLTDPFVLSPVTGLFLPPSFAKEFRKLDASVGAPGPHDFAVRESIARLATQKARNDAIASTPFRAQRFVAMAIRPS